MSTPPNIKEIWKNCTWKNDDEKLAFFNHYFKRGHIADDYCKENIEVIKQGLIEFINEGKIKVEGKERPITMKDIINEIKNI